MGNPYRHPISTPVPELQGIATIASRIDDEAIYARWLAGDETLPTLSREQYLGFQGRIDRETRERAASRPTEGAVPVGEGVNAPDRIWLCGFDTHHGDISWSSCPNPTDDPEVDGKQVEYVRNDIAKDAAPINTGFGFREAVKDILRGPDGDGYTDAGMEDAFFRWPVIARAIEAAALATQKPPVVGTTSKDGADVQRSRSSGNSVDEEARRLIERLASADIDVSGTAAIGINSADIIAASDWLACNLTGDGAGV